MQLLWQSHDRTDEPSELAAMQTRQWQQLNEVRRFFDEQIVAVEQEMAGFLVKTPYILLLSVTGINVVSAGRLAREAGPIEHYASARDQRPSRLVSFATPK